MSSIRDYKKTFNSSARRLISSLSFDGYILAGNSVANMYSGEPLKGDLDFWVLGSSNFLKIMDEFLKFSYNIFNIHTSMLEMIDSASVFPRINLILTNFENPEDVINRFDWDYCRCYWTPKSGIVYGLGFQECMITKIIMHPKSNQNRYMRIMKALKYGYKFTPSFWDEHSDLLSYPHTFNMENVAADDLIPQERRHYKFLFTDLSNVSKTIEELKFQLKIIDYEKYNGLFKELIVLKKNKSKIFSKSLLRTYVSKIILHNPLDSATTLDYMHPTINDVNGIIDGSYIIMRLGTSTATTNYTIKKINGSSEEDDNEYFKYSEIKAPLNVQDKNSDEDTENEDTPLSPIKKIKEEHKEKEIKEIVRPQVAKPFIFKILDRTPQFIQLNESGTAYLEIDYLPDPLELLAYRTFPKMWALKPEHKHKIIFFREELEVHRYSKSYLNTYTKLDHTDKSSYMYSGFDTSDNCGELPAEFKPYYEHMRLKDGAYNQVIANWYPDENSYIAPHADCTRGMVPNAKIAILSLYLCSSSSPLSSSSSSHSEEETDGLRTLTITPKKEYKHKAIYQELSIKMTQGMIITMCGTTQEEFRHGIKSFKSKCMPRISLSFRQMMPQES